MRRRILFFIFPFVIIILIILFVLLLGTKDKNFNGDIYVNIPETSGIDGYQHFYWNERNSVFFKDSNKKLCIIATRISSEETYYIREEYESIFVIPQKDCNSINDVLYYDNYFISVSSSDLCIYNLISKEIIRKKGNFEVYGIKKGKLYYKYKNKQYVTNIDFSERKTVQNIPINFDIFPVEFPFSKKAT